jgi:cyclase
MLTKRIIPCLDVRNDGFVVKGVNFVNFKKAGDPIELAKQYYKDGADELVFLDINTNENKRCYMMEVIKKVAQEIFIPLTVGGGIKTVDDIRETLLAGADKVSINKAAITNPDIISQAANMFGSQAIVVSIDAKKYGNSWKAHINGGKNNVTIDVMEWAEEAVRLGAGEILLTSIDRDGTRSGFDLDLTKMISQKINVPVIASGGAGSKEDFFEAFIKGYADGALAASLFHFKELKINDLKKYLAQLKVSIRPI